MAFFKGNELDFKLLMRYVGNWFHVLAGNIYFLREHLEEMFESCVL